MNFKRNFETLAGKKTKMFSCAKENTAKKRSAAAYNVLGDKEYEKGNPVKAIEYFTKSIEADNKYIMSYVGRAYSYYAVKQLESALIDCEILHKLFPDLPITEAIISQIKWQIKNEAQCMAIYSRFFIIQSNNLIRENTVK